MKRFFQKIKARGVILVIATLIGLPFFLNACSSSSSHSETPLTVVGFEYSPNCFGSNGEVVGFDADTARLVLENAGIAAEFSMSDSFTDAYQATLNGPNRALLSITYTEERKDLFKWVGPTSKGNSVIFIKASSGITAGLEIEACKTIDSIAVVNKGWLETTMLEDLGFENLHYFDTYAQAVDAFKNDEVTAIASDRAQLVDAVSPKYFMEENVKVATIYHGSYYFIAFSKDVDDQVIQRCQDALDALTTAGATLDIYREYIPYATEFMVPSLIQLHAENNPPYNYLAEYSGGTNIEISGSSVDIAKEIQAQSSYKNKISLTSWVDGYAALQYIPNYALLTTARTPERENLFQWVGPIMAASDHFYTLTASNLQVATLEQAQALTSVATPRGWYTHDYLSSHGFENVLATAYTAEEAFDQLLSGDAEALLLPETTVNWLCEQKGISTANLTAQYQSGYTEKYIAFSLNTPASVVVEWQSKLDAMKADGRFAAIWDKWYPGTEMP
ncbi:MAG: transporter substrate-binding domain-containing protein [Desulfuromonadaceae bacterium]|nr:transporter substrate-binding domain-containing protein [Desulfuromonadaceae bacterium]